MVGFRNFQKEIDKKVADEVKYCCGLIDSFLMEEKCVSRVSRFVESGELYLSAKNENDFKKFLQKHEIREQLRKIYRQKGWSIHYKYAWYCGNMLSPFKDKFIGINFQKYVNN